MQHKLNNKQADLIYKGLLAFTIVASLGGVLTLIPWDSASQANILGYYSLCTFAPAATVFCFFAAALSCTIRAAYFSPTARAEGSLSRGMNRHRLVRLIIIFVLGLIPAVIHVQTGLAFDAALALRTEARKEDQVTLGADELPSMGPVVPLRDGRYEGSAKSGDVEVALAVFVVDGAIHAVELISSRNLPRHVGTLLAQEAIEFNSTWVDGVSGATLSSAVWQEALAKALSLARN